MLVGDAGAGAARSAALAAEQGDARLRLVRPDDLLVRAAVGRVIDGDREAVSFLYERYANTVCRFVQRILRDLDAAEDVTQIVFLRLITKIHLYEPRAAPFETWLLSVARNVALDEIRRRRIEIAGRARRRVELARSEQAFAADEVSALSAPLRTAMASLPTAQREVVVLRLIVGLSPAETASRLRRTEASVNNLHYRGRARLRKVLVALNAGPTTTAPTPTT